MARKKAPESAEVAGFVWVHENPASNPNRERWRVRVPGISLFVSNYGQDDPRGGNFRGWRVVSGAPGKDEHPDRDAAMTAARAAIENEVKGLIAYTGGIIETTNSAMAVLRAAGIPIGSKTR
jgi:hypothetical protein